MTKPSWYHYLYGTYGTRIQGFAKEQASRLPEGAKVLDAGAGKGPFREFFRHCDYETQDFAKTPCLDGRYTDLDYVCDITEIPVDNDTYDAIICTEVLEHVPRPAEAVRELARILKLGGRLILTTPTHSFHHQVPYHFYGGFTRYWFERFLPENGLRLEMLERTGGSAKALMHEAQVFCRSIRPWRSIRHTLFWWPWLTILWLVMEPCLRLLFSPLTTPIDKLNLEWHTATGFLVLATKECEVTTKIEDNTI